MDATRRSLLAAVGGLTVAGCAAPAFDGSTADEPSADDTDGANGSDFDPVPRSETTNAYEAVYESVAPSVVRLRIATDAAAGSGSGFVVDDGIVATNDHVVAGADPDVQFRDGEWRLGEVLGRDPYSDLAVVSVSGPPAYAEPLSFVGSPPPIGTEVLAIGSPFDLGGSASRGIISGRDRTLPSPTGFSIADAVQTDAALNPGNSGGPLATLDGRVAGVVTATRGENVGFAVSAALASRVLPALIETGRYEHPYLGISSTDVTPAIAEANGLELADSRGVFVVDVDRSGPAGDALTGASDTESVAGEPVPVGGDLIVALDGAEIRTQTDLARYLALETSPGDTLDVAVIRDGAERTETVTLGARPAA
ncbi:S1C family serine protease [Haloferacaceae archaeon DSL9]